MVFFLYKALTKQKTCVGEKSVKKILSCIVVLCVGFAQAQMSFTPKAHHDSLLEVARQNRLRDSFQAVYQTRFEKTPGVVSEADKKKLLNEFKASRKKLEEFTSHISNQENTIKRLTQDIQDVDSLAELQKDQMTAVIAILENAGIDVEKEFQREKSNKIIVTDSGIFAGFVTLMISLAAITCGDSFTRDGSNPFLKVGVGGSLGVAGLIGIVTVVVSKLSISSRPTDANMVRDDFEAFFNHPEYYQMKLLNDRHVRLNAQLYVEGVEALIRLYYQTINDEQCTPLKG